MTTIQSHRSSMNILPMMKKATALLFKGIVFVSTSILGFLKTLSDAIIEGQQRKADLIIAKMLHSAEYKQHAFADVLDMVQSRNINKW